MQYDSELLRRLGALGARPWRGRVLRHAFETQPWGRANVRGARWNPRDVPALHTSLERRTGVAESDYYIAMQPVAPTVRRVIQTIEVSLSSVLDLTDLGLLAHLGIDGALLRSHPHSDCQRVDGATERLGHDGLLVPSARRGHQPRDLSESLAARRPFNIHRFHAHGIEIPFPQRDVHIRTPGEIRVLAKSGDGGVKRQRSPAALVSDQASLEP